MISDERELGFWRILKACWHRNLTLLLKNTSKLSTGVLARHLFLCYGESVMVTSHIRSGTVPNWDVNRFSCCTQAVQRCVRLVNEASGKVCGAQSRDGYIRTTQLSRSVIPNFSQKANIRVPSIEKRIRVREKKLTVLVLN